MSVITDGLLKKYTKRRIRLMEREGLVSDNAPELIRQDCQSIATQFGVESVGLEWMKELIPCWGGLYEKYVDRVYYSIAFKEKPKVTSDIAIKIRETIHADMGKVYEISQSEDSWYLKAYIKVGWRPKRLWLKRKYAPIYFFDRRARIPVRYADHQNIRKIFDMVAEGVYGWKSPRAEG